MRFGPHDDLDEERRDILTWLRHVLFGRREAAEKTVGQKIHRLGTLNFLLGK